VCTHGYCFDGLASAAIFSALMRATQGEQGLRFAYRSCGYGPKMRRVPEPWLNGDINAILDFRYTESPKLSFYFDHHPTAFDSGTERERAIDKAERSERVLFHDPSYGSCARLIADVARDTFAEPLHALADLVAWADKVDAARFDSAREAFFAEAPALVLADVVERHGDGAYLDRIVPQLSERSLDEVAGSAETKALHAPIAAAKETFLREVRTHGRQTGDIAYVDLGDVALDPAGKFATYVAFPEARYSVAVMRTRQQLKVGVGYNPWCGRSREHDIAALCSREGGGGHPVVGAINYAFEDLALAREAATRIAADLSS
jgi:hypothetical protein